MYTIPPINQLLVSNEFYQQKACTSNNDDGTLSKLPSDEAERLCDFLNQKIHRDFTVFKQSWLAKVVKRQYQSLQLKSLHEYLDHCESSDSEHEWKTIEQQLFSSPLDPDRPSNFLKLIHNHTPLLLKAFINDDNILQPAKRIWIPWCRNSSLAYTLAFYANTVKPKWLKYDELKISTTDAIKLHSSNLDASLLRALYSTVKTITINNQEAGPFQTASASSFSCQPEWIQHSQLRSQIFTGYHDPITSYPYRNLNFIISDYPIEQMTYKSREKVAYCFHSSLTTNGLLWLVKKEDHLDLPNFVQISHNPDLYRKTAHATSSQFGRDSRSTHPRKQHTSTPNIFSILSNHHCLDSRMKYQMALNELYGEIAFPTVLIDTQGAIQHTLGDTSLFLQPLAQGPFSNKLFNLLPPQVGALINPSFEKVISTGNIQRVSIPKSLSDTFLKPHTLLTKEGRNEDTKSDSTHPLTEIELIKLSDKDADYTFIAVIFRVGESHDDTDTKQTASNNNFLSQKNYLFNKQRVENLEKLVLELSKENKELRLMKKNLELINRELSKQYEEGLAARFNND